MDHLITYSGINTKVKAMGSNLINNKEFQIISNLETVSDFIAFLKNHSGYKELFNKYDEHELHRGDAERIFINGLYLDYTKIYRFANEVQRKNLELFFFRYEVTILKNCIRLVNNTEDTYDLSLFDQFFHRHSQINVAGLASSPSMEEFIQQLKGTEYYPLFVRLQSANHVTSFDYEMQLDIYYFKKTWKLIGKKLKGNSKKAILHLFGTEIDLLNIMWIYRSKMMYNMNSSEIYGYIIPVNYKLTKEQLMKLISTETTQDFLTYLNTTHYVVMYQAIQENDMENYYQKVISKLYKENKAKFPASMATVNYYLYQKEREISRLTTALECIRYGLNPQERLKYILQ